jgi:hypothetical protein
MARSTSVNQLSAHALSVYMCVSLSPDLGGVVAAHRLLVAFASGMNQSKLNRITHAGGASLTTSPMRTCHIGNRNACTYPQVDLQKPRFPRVERPNWRLRRKKSSQFLLHSMNSEDLIRTRTGRRGLLVPGRSRTRGRPWLIIVIRHIGIGIRGLELEAGEQGGERLEGNDEIRSEERGGKERRGRGRTGDSEERRCLCQSRLR